ncbi:MAG TPA: hypothetical protein VK841_22505 [Polyangiaceae bacterium]|jgi:hypothetical protein|nr:hypothetical protein [Polyangiaceae bacterium]
MNAPDYATIKRAAAEVRRLAAAGELTRAAFDKQWKLARNACGGDGDLLGGLARYAKPGWINVQSE